MARPQGVQQSGRDARAGGADGMAEGDGAAVYVELVAVEVQLPVARQNLRGERFVELDQIDLVQPHACTGEHFARGRHGTNAHDLRIHARLRVPDDACHRLQSMGLDRRGDGDEHRPGTVRHAARVTGAYAAILAEYVFELRLGSDD